MDDAFTVEEAHHSGGGGGVAHADAGTRKDTAAVDSVCTESRRGVAGGHNGDALDELFHVARGLLLREPPVLGRRQCVVQVATVCKLHNDVHCKARTGSTVATGPRASTTHKQ